MTKGLFRFETEKTNILPIKANDTKVEKYVAMHRRKLISFFYCIS
jgi:hypothetical protein